MSRFLEASAEIPLLTWGNDNMTKWRSQTFDSVIYHASTTLHRSISPKLIQIHSKFWFHPYFSQPKKQPGARLVFWSGFWSFFITIFMVSLNEGTQVPRTAWHRAGVWGYHDGMDTLCLGCANRDEPMSCWNDHFPYQMMSKWATWWGLSTNQFKLVLPLGVS